jgi:hypothetical protein
MQQIAEQMAEQMEQNHETKRGDAPPPWETTSSNRPMANDEHVDETHAETALKRHCQRSEPGKKLIGEWAAPREKQQKERER